MTYMMNYHPKYTKTFKMQQYKTQYIVKQDKDPNINFSKEDTKLVNTTNFGKTK